MGSIEHGVFDETNFTSPATPDWQEIGVSILDQRDAIIMIPKDPLIPGNYTASITANNQDYTWSFNVI